jgi:hypothetical protein
VARLGSLPALALGAALAFSAPARGADPWAVFAETGTVEILTRDEDGDLRETPIWIVVQGEAGYVRTNDSRWLANIRRGSPIEVRAEGAVLPVRAEEQGDPADQERVEEAFKAKYGWVQRVMSSFRMRRPTVLRLTALPGGE